MNFLKQQSRCWPKRDSLANCWPKSPFWPAVGRKVPLRPTGGRQGDTFDFSALGCIVSEFAIKIIIVSKKSTFQADPLLYVKHGRIVSLVLNATYKHIHCFVHIILHCKNTEPVGKLIVSSPSVLFHGTISTTHHFYVTVSHYHKYCLTAFFLPFTMCSS